MTQNIREIIEKREHLYMREVASFADRSRGRLIAEKQSDVRTDFQRDRDRIIHSKSFRRLKHKTQVYIAPLGDHYRTRLTHTLEVAQIGRTIARALFLNEDLVEAIALGHDIGHTPFGHAGERVLSNLSNKPFRHYEQSLRVVDFLESHGNQRGLNLTFEVRDGILNHSGKNKARTLEGDILKLADRIAYINHDIDDSIRAGFLKESDIPKDIINTLGNSCGKRIDTLVLDVISYSEGKDYVKMSDEINDAMMKLRDYMFDKIYNDDRSKAQSKQIEKLMRELYYYYCEHPVEMGQHLNLYKENEDIETIVTDYIAGMTDQFAIEKFKEIMLPTRFRRV